eukprot:TRINITY_DN1762_c0_g3_i1.p1 TRINITY_DN1762_c0_g3~~TRINITY_DN1762_c0_g3_i1.p1  ORF type:complete len:127 (-),score=21.74 TRINITY_DN1762_c0_g3_i1:144-524(-)
MRVSIGSNVAASSSSLNQLSSPSSSHEQAHLWPLHEISAEKETSKAQEHIVPTLPPPSHQNLLWAFPWNQYMKMEDMGSVHPSSNLQHLYLASPKKNDLGRLSTIASLIEVQQELPEIAIIIVPCA